MLRAPNAFQIILICIAIVSGGVYTSCALVYAGYSQALVHVSCGFICVMWVGSMLCDGFYAMFMPFYSCLYELATYVFIIHACLNFTYIGFYELCIGFCMSLTCVPNVQIDV